MHDLYQGHATPQGHNINIISNHIHIYMTFMRIVHILWIILVFCNTFRPIEIISFYLIQKCNTLKTYWK